MDRGSTMNYLYGDSSTSPFTSNILEFLRDAIDFSVYLLEADRRISATQTEAIKKGKQADSDIEELDALREAAVQAIESTSKGAEDSPVTDCATQMSTACADTVAAAMASVRSRLEAQVAQAEAEEETEREGCVSALLALLAPHVPPDSSTVLGLTLNESGQYEARLNGVWQGATLKWSWRLGFPEGHPFTNLLRVEDVLPRFELNAPELTGWIKKEVKTRAQHLDRYAITRVISRGSQVTVHLRTEPGSDAGFDLVADSEKGTATASRVVSESEQAASGEFDLTEEDVPKVIELCRALQTRLNDAKAPRLIEAKFADGDFVKSPTFSAVVEQIVAYMAPLVREIAAHSLEPNELVLRRQLADDRREEIFVSKNTLREKYAKLSDDLRAVFAPLGLESSLSRSVKPPSRPPPGTSRSELTPSKPPPPPSKPPPIAPPPPRSPGFASIVSGLGSPTSERADAPPAKRESAKPAAAQADKDEGSDEPAAAFQRILEHDQAGRQQEAHNECAALLERPGFSAGPTDVQRRALKLLLVLGAPASPQPTRTRALRAGCDRARELIERLKDPMDYEILGLCQTALGESAAAADTFKQGLELERSRNPSSELGTRLARHAGKT